MEEESPTEDCIRLSKEYGYTSDFAFRVFRQDYAKGMARSLLIILRARGFSASQEVHDRVRACADLEQLRRWIEHAAVIEGIDELFADAG